MSARTFLPDLADIAAIIDEECTARSAQSVDCYRDDRRLISRAVFGTAESVRLGDEIHGGVAVRVDGPSIFVHPFSWRKVCSNGAIATTVRGSHRVERIEVDVTVASAAFVASVITDLRTAIDRCAQPTQLTEAVDRMRTAAEVDGTLAITILGHLMQVAQAHHEFLLAILDRHTSGDDPSAYGLFNAVTSVARDTADPEARWHLERAGGALLEHVARLATTTPQLNDVLVGV